MSFLARLFGTDDTALAADDFLDQRTPESPVLDVRTPTEFATGHLAGAKNIDVQAPDFADQIQALELPKDEPVYLYCRTGNRSGRAASMLRQIGYEEAYNIGGYGTLKAAGAVVEE